MTPNENQSILKIIRPSDLLVDRHTETVDAQTLREATQIVEQVRLGGEPALRKLTTRLDGRSGHQPLVYFASNCQEVLEQIPADDRALLERVADRVRAFAAAQRATIMDLEFPVPGGTAGHRWVPVQTAGCYAPGGRFPLVSSLLMTAVTARVAGVPTVWVACPAPSPTMLAAAAIVEADGFLAAGGAQAIAAFAFGVGGPPRCDVVVGPGNRWVTAAKQSIAWKTGIDLLAGPSELVVVADDSSDPQWVAADLLAQAEHDVDALPILIASSEAFVAQVNEAIQQQILELDDSRTALESLRRGGALVESDPAAVIGLCQKIAPEHLHLQVTWTDDRTKQLTRCGCLFVGANSAEVFGDYGAGPNHVLPTGGTARFASGLSVETFLRRQTWLRMDDSASAQALIDDSIRLAELEGMTGHAASARLRRVPCKPAGATWASRPY